MTKTAKNIALIAFFIVSMVGVAAWASNRTAAEFKAKEAIAMQEIHRLNNTIQTERLIMAAQQDSIDVLKTQISLATVKVEEAMERVRAAEAELVNIDDIPEFVGPDSSLVASLNETIEEPEDFVILCDDQFGFSKFCFNRSLASEVLITRTITLPTLRETVFAYRDAVDELDQLMAGYIEQVRLQEDRHASVLSINSALTLQVDEYRDLYELANRAYKREKLFKNVSLGAVATGVLVFILAN